jgi:DNA invertase Pin-like site-specific DNA recombinase
VAIAIFSEQFQGTTPTHKQGVQLKNLTDVIDTGTASGRFVFHVMASLAETERELTIERTQAGLRVVCKLGRVGGRKPRCQRGKIKSAKKPLTSGVPPRDVAANLGVSVLTACQWVLASPYP